MAETRVANSGVWEELQWILEWRIVCQAGQFEISFSSVIALTKILAAEGKDYSYIQGSSWCQLSSLDNGQQLSGPLSICFQCIVVVPDECESWWEAVIDVRWVVFAQLPKDHSANDLSMWSPRPSKCHQRNQGCYKRMRDMERWIVGEMHQAYLKFLLKCSSPGEGTRFCHTAASNSRNCWGCRPSVHHPAKGIGVGSTLNNLEVGASCFLVDGGLQKWDGNWRCTE